MTIIVLKLEVWFYNVVKCLKEGVVANSGDPDQTAPEEQSDLCLPCFLSPVCSNT